LSVQTTLTQLKFYVCLDSSSLFTVTPISEGVSLISEAVRGLQVWIFGPTGKTRWMPAEWLQCFVSHFSVCWRTKLLLFGLHYYIIQVSRSSTEWQTALWINCVL